MAAFWAELLGWDVAEEDPDGVELVAPDGSRPSLVFVPVADPKRVKNRIHLDVRPYGCDQPEELARLLSIGAVEVDVGQGDQTWHVLADPEGNEFCLLRTRAD